MVDLRQSEEWADWLSRSGWTIVQVNSVSGKRFAAFIRRFPLGFSVIKLQRFDEPLDFNSLNRLKKKYRVVQTILEPANERAVEGMKENGYHLSRSPYLPTKTRVIDLVKSEKELIKEMSENFRRILKKKKNFKVTVISTDEFYKGWQKWAKSLILTRNQFEKIIASFGKNVEFWSAKKGKKVLSTLMLLYTADSCFYYQTWTTNEGRKSSPHVWLTFETMKRAKKLGKKFYNFEGVQDKRFPLHKWEGFSEFKRRFGGVEIEYPGCFTKWF